MKDFNLIENNRIFLILVAVGITYGSAIETAPFECECFNHNDSVNGQSADKCDQHGRVVCTAPDSDKIGACFALWNTDNVTGKTTFQFNH